MCENTLDCFYEAELLRLQAECRQQLGDASAAEAGFIRALEIARRQSATLFAIRAAGSLARLLVEQDQNDRAREELNSVLRGVFEGLDTTEVAGARKLLDALT